VDTTLQDRLHERQRWENKEGHGQAKSKRTDAAACTLTRTWLLSFEKKEEDGGRLCVCVCVWKQESGKDERRAKLFHVDTHTGAGGS
jgi:hypothetical protein